MASQLPQRAHKARGAVYLICSDYFYILIIKAVSAPEELDVSRTHERSTVPYTAWHNASACNFNFKCYVAAMIVPVVHGANSLVFFYFVAYPSVTNGNICQNEAQGKFIFKSRRGMYNLSNRRRRDLSSVYTHKVKSSICILAVAFMNHKLHSCFIGINYFTLLIIYSLY